MITIDVFMEIYCLKSKKMVLHWIEKGYIKGVKKEENRIMLPERSRPPYTLARAKTVPSIYKSIVKACICNKSVCAKLYSIGDKEFELYIEQLENFGYIQKITENGIDYYYSTLSSENFLLNNSNLLTIFLKTVEAYSAGKKISS